MIRLRVFDDVEGFDLYLKLENMQNTNSFKIRGVANQFYAHQVGTKVKSFVTMSAGIRVIIHTPTKWLTYFLGNYGRAFAYASEKLGLTDNHCLMPDSAPAHRQIHIENCGVKVDKMPSNQLLEGIRQVQKWKLKFSSFSPFPYFYS